MQVNLSNIFIIGAGAIGKTLAVLLQSAGKNVTLVRGSVNDGSSYIGQLSVLMTGGIEKKAEIKIVTLDSLPVLDGLIVLTNKSFGNEQLAAALKQKAGNAPLVILQNGLGVEQPFIDHHYPQIYRCVLFVTSQPVNNTTVRFKPVTVCPVGIIKGDSDVLNDIVQQLNTAAFQFRSEEAIQQIIWKKAITNIVFNSVCPLLDIDNGVFHRNTSAVEIARRIIAECIVIAKEKGIPLEADEVEAALLQISKASDGQIISTLQDIRNHRKTEIDTLNFELVRIAATLNMEHRVQETKLLGELTRLKSLITMKN